MIGHYRFHDVGPVYQDIQMTIYPKNTESLPHLYSFWNFIITLH